jgi:hypothetical protein
MAKKLGRDILYCLRKAAHVVQVFVVAHSLQSSGLTTLATSSDPNGKRELLWEKGLAWIV